jgi:hypothetical protein
MVTGTMGMGPTRVKSGMPRGHEPVCERRRAYPAASLDSRLPSVYSDSRNSMSAARDEADKPRTASRDLFASPPCQSTASIRDRARPSWETRERTPRESHRTRWLHLVAPPESAVRAAGSGVVSAKVAPVGTPASGAVGGWSVSSAHAATAVTRTRQVDRAPYYETVMCVTNRRTTR